MTIQFTNRQALALRKHAVTTLRKHDIKDVDAISVHGLSWKALNDLESDIKRQARAMLDGLKKDAPEDEAREVETAHDAILEIFDLIEREKDIRSNIGDKGPRAAGGNPMRPIPKDGQARGDDDGYQTADAEEASVLLRRDQSYTQWLLENRKSELRDYRGLTTGDYLRAMIVGPRNDVEKRALAEGTDSAGGFTVPDVLSARLIDRMRAASTVIQAGAQTVPLMSDVNYVAKVLTDPAPAWRNENAAIAESDPTFGRVTLTARSLGVIVRVSRELLEDSLNIGTALPNIIATAMAAELDRAALLGSGTAPEPRGVANFSSLTANSFTGGMVTGYSPFVQLRSALKGVNANLSAYVMHPRTEGNLTGALSGDGQPLIVPPAIANIPMLTTTKIAINGGVGTNEAKVFAGEWSRLLIGIRHQLRIEILKERYADVNQYAFVAVLRADVAAEFEAAFTVMSGVTN